MISRTHYLYMKFLRSAVFIMSDLSAQNRSVHARNELQTNQLPALSMTCLVKNGDSTTMSGDQTKNTRKTGRKQRWLRELAGFFAYVSVTQLASARDPDVRHG